MNKNFIAPLALIIGVAFAAEPPLLKNDPRRPTAQISRDLGVSQVQFIQCFNSVTPVQGEKPSDERLHTNKALLLPCLQKANPTITNKKLDEVMDRYRKN